MTSLARDDRIGGSDTGPGALDAQRRLDLTETVVMVERVERHNAYHEGRQ